MTRKPIEFSQLSEIPDLLEYTGEFGNELVLFLPFVNWLSEAGLLKSRAIKTYAGMASFYDGLHYAGYLEKDDNRVFEHLIHRPWFLPNICEDNYNPSPYYSFPDLRKKFQSRDFSFIHQKPLLVVHNKYNIEWSNKPINYFSTDLLDRIFSATRDVFTVVYIRHKQNASYRGFSWDHNTNIDEFDDASVVAKYGHVHEFDEIYEEFGNGLDVNTFKNLLCARCFYFVSSQGGATYHFAYFSGSAMSILHRQGFEMRAAYADGLFRMLSSPPPDLMICLDEEDVLASVEAMVRSRIFAGRVMFFEDSLCAVETLSVVRQRPVYYRRESEYRALREAEVAGLKPS